MANCPKCGAHLKFTDWRPECPKCGVNMIYYGMEEQLLHDAEKAEAEHAVFQKRMDRMKASLIGGPLQIARIVCAVIPVAGLFLPLALLKLGEAPYMQARDVSVNVLTIVNYISNLLDVNGLMAMMKTGILGRTFQYYAVSIIALLLCVVLGLFAFFRLICSAKRKSCVKNVVISALQLLLLCAGVFAFGRFSSGISYIFPSFISASLGFGIYVYALLHLPKLIIDLIFAIKPMKVRYKEDEEAAKAADAPAEETQAEPAVTE